MSKESLIDKLQNLRDRAPNAAYDTMREAIATVHQHIAMQQTTTVCSDSEKDANKLEEPVSSIVMGQPSVAESQSDLARGSSPCAAPPIQQPDDCLTAFTKWMGIPYDPNDDTQVSFLTTWQAAWNARPERDV